MPMFSAAPRVVIALLLLRVGRCQSCDPATDVEYEGNCYWLDGTNGVCVDGGHMGSEDILRAIASQFVGKTYKTTQSQNCCPRHDKDSTQKRNFVVRPCNAAGPFTELTESCNQSYDAKTAHLTFCEKPLPTPAPTMNHCRHLNNAFVDEEECSKVPGCGPVAHGDNDSILCDALPDNECATLTDEECESSPKCEVEPVSGYCAYMAESAPKVSTRAASRCASMADDFELCYHAEGCDFSWSTGECSANTENTCDDLTLEECIETETCAVDWTSGYCAPFMEFEFGNYAGACASLRKEECRARPGVCTWNKDDNTCADYVTSEELECGFQTKISVSQSELVEVLEEVRGPCSCQGSCLSLGFWHWRFDLKNHRCNCIDGRFQSSRVSRSNRYFSSAE